MMAPVISAHWAALLFKHGTTGWYENNFLKKIKNIYEHE